MTQEERDMQTFVRGGNPEAAERSRLGQGRERNERARESVGRFVKDYRLALEDVARHFGFESLNAAIKEDRADSPLSYYLRVGLEPLERFWGGDVFTLRDQKDSEKLEAILAFCRYTLSLYKVNLDEPVMPLINSVQALTVRARNEGLTYAPAIPEFNGAAACEGSGPIPFIPTNGMVTIYLTQRISERGKSPL